MINLCKIVPAISQLVLYRELEEQIRSKDIPHKFFYWDFHCSDLWRILADSSHFQTHNQFACLLDDKFNEIHNVIIDCTNKKPYDLISLGVGIGEDDIVILKEIVKNLINSKEKYRCSFIMVDISVHLIKYALMRIKEKIQNLADFLDVAIFNIDIFELDKYEFHFDACSENPRLFCFLGSTLGNYEEYSLLCNLSKIMRKEDFFLLGVDCPIGKYGDDKILKRYSEADEGFNFLLGPLRSYGILAKIKKEEAIRLIFPDFPVEDPIPIVTNSKHILHKIDLDRYGHGIIKLNKSTKYHLDSLKKWLRDQFKFKILYETKPDEKYTGLKIEGCYYTLLLLSKTEIIHEDYERTKCIERIKELCVEIGKTAGIADSEDKGSIFNILNRLRENLTKHNFSNDSLIELENGLNEVKGFPSNDSLDKLYKEFF